MGSTTSLHTASASAPGLLGAGQQRKAAPGSRRSEAPSCLTISPCSDRRKQASAGKPQLRSLPRRWLAGSPLPFLLCLTTRQSCRAAGKPRAPPSPPLSCWAPTTSLQLLQGVLKFQDTLEPYLISTWLCPDTQGLQQLEKSTLSTRQNYLQKIIWPRTKQQDLPNSSQNRSNGLYRLDLGNQGKEETVFTFPKLMKPNLNFVLLVSVYFHNQIYFYYETVLHTT